MSQQLISRSPDLTRLRDDGYELEVRSNLLIVGHVPYLNGNGQVQFGRLVTELTLAGDVTTTPESHVVHFSGTAPHDSHGRPLDIVSSSDHRALGEGIDVDYSFSQKPAGGYANYYDKLTTYVAILSGPARSVDANVTATTFPLVEDTNDQAVFCYMDTASSRAGLNRLSERLAIARVAIVGLGGTGAYILDLVAKTHVKEIHLYDGDVFSQHNAFRSPGAASLDELRAKPLKVDFHEAVYSRMRHGILRHGFVTDSNVDEMRGMDFVFLSLDKGTPKRLLVERLTQYGVPFVDAGMGIYKTDGADSIAGLIRVTLSTPSKRDHIATRVAFLDGDPDNEYSANIQVAELNALNAALAVIKWKKHLGFYTDFEHEHHSVYQIDGNLLTNDEQA